LKNCKIKIRQHRSLLKSHRNSRKSHPPTSHLLKQNRFRKTNCLDLPELNELQRVCSVRTTRRSESFNRSRKPKPSHQNWFPRRHLLRCCIRLSQALDLSILKISELVRSLSDISPFYNYESPRQRAAVLNENMPESKINLVPIDIELPDNELKQRLSPDRLFAWEASNLFHNPLYFEDAPLERYGHSRPFFLQPLFSLTRMSVQLLGMPYQSVIDTPHTKRYTLGWYRPGEPAPHLHYQIPLNIEAAAAQGLVVTGAAFLVP
jgi:hypothetical protein